jgi:trigger factor
MQINIDNPGGCKRVIRAEVPAETVSAKLSESYRDINKQVQMPGFRKGKAPRNVLEKKFGADVTSDIRQTLADDVMKQAIAEHKLQVLGQPEVVESGDIKNNAPATFSIEVEVRPEFELPEYKGLELDRPEIEIKDHEVYAVMRSDQFQRGDLEPVDGPAEKEHIIRCSIKVTCQTDEGEEPEVLLDRPAGLLEVGQEWIAGLNPKEGPEALVGLKAGEQREFKLDLPDDFPRKELRGKPATIVVVCVEVSSFEGPSLEDVCKQRGFEGMDEWKADVRDKLRSDREAEVDQMIEQQALQKVADQTEMELPEKFSQRRTAELIQQEAYRMYQAGHPEESIREFLDNSKAKGDEETKAMLKRAFVLDAIARAERIVVTEDEIKREIQALADRIGQPVEQVETILREQDRIAGMREDLRTGKVMKLLRQKAKYV